ncbi:hypothetical protein Ait01nite_053870 [Actinoplanes italicus]|uniref:Phosphopantetheine binding protein n=1 Tax=Actinoplanes italicus TaxID=113567 RepID=A0A2T0K8C2_9ACTN|nr:beta-ketoacyl synthase N-terminal-like domain-containing protein [Actinoplanes italicus]PRX19081.1 phosphopantetheine binding protein [Actinoplanes italicus]GIE32342.1 hypothetical protein Ait01nite_053870 [Actinoplanes italicus]
MTPRPEPERVESPLDIAVVGVGGYYPGSTDMASLWETLRTGADRVAEIPKERWDWRAHHDERRGRDQKSYGKWGAFLDDVAGFDASFFDVLPSDAEIMDPQERLFLEVVWSLLEETGYLGTATHEKSTGVFVGLMYETYGRIAATGWNSGQLTSADSTAWRLANMVSYQCDFQGPSYAVGSACSSSLTAVHLACQSIRSGECRMAVAGGANLILHPAHLAGLASRGMLSPEGRCRTFDAGANGFVPGEGVGAVLLKSLADAEADNDEIWGVIKASFVNSAGRRSGFTVPNPTAQADLITEAIRRAGVTPQSIGYIEAHGTGTKLGDPLETAALNAALTPRADGAQNATAGPPRCAVGSVKANIGHLEGAAGIAGLTKLLLQLRHRQIAPCVHLDKVNPMIDTESGRFYFPTELTDWVSEPGTPRRGGVSSFGSGGAGAHVIVEEYPDERRRSRATTDADGEEDVLLLSARTLPQLRIIAERTAELLAGADAPGLRALTYMAALRRKEMPVRLAVLGRNIEEVLAGLRSFQHGDDVPRVCHGTAVPQHAGGGNSEPVVAQTREYRELARLARLWTQGSVVDWSPVWPGPRPFPVTLPRYPFAKKPYWIPLAQDPEPVPSPSVTVASDAASSDRAPTEKPVPSRLSIEQELRSLATRFLRVPESEIDVDLDLVMLGFDSIALIQLVGDLQDTYEIDLDEAVDAVLSDHLSLAGLADHVERATAAGHVPATMPELGER